MPIVLELGLKTGTRYKEYKNLRRGRLGANILHIQYWRGEEGSIFLFMIEAILIL